MRERVIFGAIAVAIFIPFLLIGGLTFQIFAAALAVVGVYEMFRMKGLNFFTVEGILTMFATMLLVIPMDLYVSFLPSDSRFVAFGIAAFMILAGIVFNSSKYSIDDAVYPIATSFYVGLGFQNLVNARMAGMDKVLLALFIVWATDIGAYMIGRQVGRHKLMPRVSPNKTIEGSIGGIVSALVVSIIFMLVRPAVYVPHNFFVMLLLVVLFSIFGQFGDLVESAIKRHYNVKDSGKLIPGHGGILDRFDSLIFVFPIMHLFGLF